MEPNDASEEISAAEKVRTVRSAAHTFLMHLGYRSFLPAALILSLTSSLGMGCAHVPEGTPVGVSFPENFALTQIIPVHRGESELKFIASLSRRGSDYQLAMLDPVIQNPLYIAKQENGRFIELRPLPEKVREMGPMLFSSLVELFETQKFSLQKNRTASGEEEDRLVFWTRRFEFSVTPWDVAASCPFPMEIRMKTLGGPELSVSARTEDVSCGE